MEPLTSRTSCAADQTVVSVGPYMLRSRQGRDSFTWAASAGGSASPPNSKARRGRRAAGASGSCISRRICEGVHCMSVAPYLAACAAGE